MEGCVKLYIRRRREIDMDDMGQECARWKQMKIVRESERNGKGKKR